MNIHVGQVESVRRTFGQADFDRFAALSGDRNPIHVDPAFAARTSFGATVAHGMLLYGTVCGVLGTRFPGVLQLKQELKFPSPTYAGEEVTIQVEAAEVWPAEGLADLTTVVVRPDGSVGLEGRTLVQLPVEGSYAAILPASDAPAPESTCSLAFKGFRVGQQAKTRRTFTTQDLDEYAELTGDTNPIFTDASSAAGLGLDGPMIPGSLLGALFSYLLGTQLPGRGTNYLKQRLVFPAPAYPGDELTATVEITRLRPEKELVNLQTVCTSSTGEPVCKGEALVLVTDVEGG